MALKKRPARAGKKTGPGIPDPKTPVSRPVEDPDRISIPIDVTTRLVTGNKWGWYLLALIVPFAGVFIGLFLYDMDSRDVRRVGRISLLIGFSVWVLLPALMFLSVFLLSVVTLMDWLSRIAPGV